MKKICSLILIVIVIISTAIYQYYYHDGSPNDIVILDESHELVDTSIKETVSSRILAVYLDEPYYYFLGYDGIGRYDIRNHMLDVLEFEIYGSLDVNIAQGEPIIAHYRAQDLVHDIEGNQDINDVFSDIEKVLTNLK